LTLYSIEEGTRYPPNAGNDLQQITKICFIAISWHFSKSLNQTLVVLIPKTRQFSLLVTSCFVPDRRGADTVIIVQENRPLHELKNWQD